MSYSHSQSTVRFVQIFAILMKVNWKLSNYLTVSRAHFSTHWGHVFFFCFPAIFYLITGSIHPRKFCNHVTVHRPPDSPYHRHTTLSSYNSLGACSLLLYIHVTIHVIQLTAVKTVYSLTIIAWPYRALRYRPTEFEYFFEIIGWQVATFQMTAGSSSIFFKCMWNKLCSWAAPLKFGFQTDLGRENSCREGSRFWLFSPWSRVGHALLFIFMLWLVKIWQVSSCGKWCSIWKLVFW